MLCLERLAAESIIDDPYPHLVCPAALEHADSLNEDFPSKDRFGPQQFEWMEISLQAIQNTKS